MRRGEDDARLATLESGPRMRYLGVVPSVASSGAGPTLCATITVPAVTYQTYQIASAQLLINGSVADNQFEFGIYDGATTGGTLLRAIRWHTPTTVGNVDQRSITATDPVLVPAGTAKTYTLWATRTAGAGVVSITGDPRYSVMLVEYKAAS